MDLLDHLPPAARRLTGMPGHITVSPTTDTRLVRDVLRACGHAHHVPDASWLLVAEYVSTLDQRLVLGATTFTMLHRDQVAALVRSCSEVDPDTGVLLAQHIGPFQQVSGRLGYARHLAVLEEGARHGVERLLGLGLLALARRRGLDGLLLRQRVRPDQDSDRSLARTSFRRLCQLDLGADPDPRTADRCPSCQGMCHCPVQFHIADLTTDAAQDI